jgi:F-type H+-transporting ATPase subunit delta
MAEGKIAVRYARALFQAATDMGILDKVREDLSGILLIDSELPEFRDLIQSPVMNVSRKKGVFKSIFEKKVNDLSLRFILLLADNKREAYLPAVCRVYIDLYKKEKGIRSATVTTAGEIQEETAAKIKSSLEEYYKCSIELGTRVKPELIGGFVLRIEDEQIDASVANQLNRIRKGLDKSVIS